MEKPEIIKIILQACISSAVINTLITHWLYSRKARIEQIKRSENAIWDKKFNALDDLYSCINEIDVFNFLQFQLGPLDEDYPSGETGRIVKVTSPVVMNDYDAFMKFGKSISEKRQNYTKYFTVRTNAVFYCFERYFTSIAQFVDKYSLKENINLLGVVLYPEIQNLSEAMKKVLQREINHPKYRLSLCKGFYWESLTNAYVKKYWEKSLLHDLTWGIKSHRTDKAWYTINRRIIADEKVESGLADSVNEKQQ